MGSKRSTAVKSTSLFSFRLELIIVLFWLAPSTWIWTLFSAILVNNNMTSDITWTHQITLSGNMKLKWTTNDTTWITMEMSAPTTGYLGIGISPHGGMAGSDIVLGWVNENGSSHFKDYHGVENGAPIKDAQQDYELIYALEDSTGTRFVFRRKWNTCDSNDLPIANRMVRLIWAWHAVDPKRLLPWHGPGIHRGTRRINFMNPENFMKFPDQKDGFKDGKAIYWDARLYNVRVPISLSYNHCQIFKFPSLRQKHHIIGYRPLLEHAPYIRSISLNICQVPKHYGETKDYFEKYVTNNIRGYACYEPQIPKDWIQFCVVSQVAYSLGGEGLMLPEHLGTPIGDIRDDPMYFLLNVQYENPEGHNILDSSGLRIFYTIKLREYDTGMLIIGHRRTPFFTIPPFQHRFKITGFCSGKCTLEGIRSGDVRIFSVLFYSNAKGKEMILRHIRQGTELPIIAQENHYDTKYQEYRILSKEVRFMPEDELILECYFDTSDRSSFTFGGPSPESERCEATIMYYPKSNLADCRSQPEFYSYLNAFGVGNITGNVLDKLGLPFLNGEKQDVIIADDTDILYLENQGSSLVHEIDALKITSPQKLANLNWLTYLNGLIWTDGQFVQNIESQWRNGLHYMFCATTSGQKIYLKTNVLKITNYEPIETWSEIQNCEKLESGLRNDGNMLLFCKCGWSIIIILLWTMLKW